MTPEQRYALAMRQQQIAMGNPLAGQTFDPGSPLVGQMLDPGNPMQGGMPQQGAAGGGPAPNALPDRPQLTEEQIRAQNESFSGLENAIDSQRSYADMLRGTPSAELQRVGPSNIAVSNIWDGLEVGFNRALGGYMAGKANKKDAELDEKRTEQALSKAKAAEANAAYEDSIRRNELLYGRSRHDVADEQYAEEVRREDARLAAAAERESMLDRERLGARNIETRTIPGVGEPIETLVDSFGRRTYAKGPLAGQPVEPNTVDYNTYVDNMRQQAALDADATDDQVTDAAKQIDTDLIKYGKDLQKSNLPAVLNSIDEVDTLLSKLPGIQIDEETGEILNPDKVDVPGTGYAQNIPLAGGVAQLLSGEGEEGTQLRAARQKVKSEILKLMSGAAVTLPEQIRNDIATAMDWANNDEDFLRTWPAIKRSIQAAKDNYDAAYSPMVTEIYDRRQRGDRLTSEEYIREQREIERLKKELEED